MGKSLDQEGKTVTTTGVFTSIRAEDKFDNSSASIPINNGLAIALGVEAAAIIQQLHYWMTKPSAGWLLRDGTKWLLNGYKEWSKQIQWLKPRQLGKIVRWLEQRKLIITSTIDKLLKIGFVLGEGQLFIYHPNNRRKWYGGLNYEELALLTNGAWNPLGLVLKELKAKRDANVTDSDIAVDSSMIKQCHSECQSSYRDYQYSTKTLSETSERKEVKQNSKMSEDSSVEILSEGKSSTSLSNLNEDKHSAGARKSNWVKTDYSLQGFESQEERDGFYQALLELGNHKSGVRSAVGWANAIIKAINVGEPCEYLNEYRRGEPVGTCEKHEWEIAPGRPYPQFISYLKRRLKTNALTDEQAIGAAYKDLQDVNLAKSLWESCKRAIANAKNEWDKQRELGVSSASIPPELLPEPDVSLSEAAEAMQALQQASAQLSMPAAMSENLLSTQEEPELPTSKNTAAMPAEQEATLTESDEDTKQKSQIERMRGYLKSGHPFFVKCVKKWLENNPDMAHLVTDDEPNLSGG